MGRINVLVVCPNESDATSFYRGMGPLGLMHRQFPALHLIQAQVYKWNTLNLCDVVFMQRPYRAEDLRLLEYAKDMGKKVWVDFDDDLFSVPRSNPTYKIYGKDETRVRVATIIAKADHVTVSTQVIKDRLQKGPKPLNEKITVIPNGYHDELFGEFPKNTNPKRLVFWRGSPTHNQDILANLQGITDAYQSEKLAQWTFMFLGGAPWELTEALPGNRSIFADPVDIMEYFKLLQRIQPSVALVPLHDMEFNHAKSNIAWIEAAYAGAVTVAPDWKEWHVPGCFNYSDQNAIRETLEYLVENPQAILEQNRLAREYIFDNLRLSKLNVKRMEVLESLL